MTMTSQEIRDQAFSGADQGHEPAEVRAYLNRVADVVDQLRTQVEQLKAGKEEILEVLVTAKRIGKDMERGARSESDVIVGEARLEAERVLMDAAEERTKMEGETLELRRLHATMMGELRGVVETFGKMVEDLDQAAAR